MLFIERHTAPPLASVVPRLTYQSGHQTERAVERLVPSPTATLWINLNINQFCRYEGPVLTPDIAPGAMLAGPSTRHSIVEFEANRAHVSAELSLGAATLLGIPLEGSTDDYIPLSDLWGSDGRLLRERLLEAPDPPQALGVLEETLTRRFALGAAPDPAVQAAASYLSAGLAVSEVAERLGLLPRSLRRRFIAQVGMTPKRFGRVTRLQRTVSSLQSHKPIDWATTAAEHGYYDQAHLIDDFNDLIGLTPTAYLALRSDGPNHLRLPQDPPTTTR